MYKLIIWRFRLKSLELLCVSALYIAFDALTINDITNMLTRFDETRIQLFSISLSVIVLRITIHIVLFGPIENPNFHALN